MSRGCTVTPLPAALLKTGVLSQAEINRLHADALAEVDAAFEQALREPQPTAADIPRYTYAASKVDAVYPDDFTGLPE